MNLQEFNIIRAHLAQGAGIQIDEDKEYLVTNRLNPLCKKFDAPSVSALIQRLMNEPSNDLEVAIVEALTTNETSFLRDRSLFTALKEGIFPELLESRQQSRSLTIWSAACSSGQEIYSIKILLKENFPELSNWNTRFIATDIDSSMVERTKLGSYSDVEIARGLPECFRSKYFRKSNGAWRIDEEMKSNLTVSLLNLHGPWSQIPSCDLIISSKRAHLLR